MDGRRPEEGSSGIDRRTSSGVLDRARLAAVRATGLLDGVGSVVLDELAALASRLLRAPMAFVTVVDEERSYWVSCVGTPATQRQNPVAESFCQYVVTDAAPLVVEDAEADPRTRDNPSLTSMGVRAWAGFPLQDGAGNTLGSFCVVDTAARRWTSDDVEVLRVLSRAASAQVALLDLVRAQQAARDDAARLRQAERRAEARLRRLTAAAMQLPHAETVEDLTRIVVNRGLAVLGADGGAVAVREADQVRLAVSDRLGEQVQVTYGLLPLDSPLPAAYTTRTGERVLLPTRACGLAFTPEIEQVYADTGRDAWAVLPLRVDGRLLGALAVSWVAERTFADDELRLLDGFAAQCALALDRILNLQAQRATALATQRLSETLQRSMLTQPPTPDELRIAVGYRSAAQEAQVGGDWYDAFVTAAGATLLVIGDVLGHDRIAAAAMGQVRNVLRGLAYDSDDSPAILLGRLDRALRGLKVNTMATAVLARVEQDDRDRARGVRRLRWSNAGHLPPLLRRPDGTVDVLDEHHDLLLGVDPGATRGERVVDLDDGATLLLYTDGLVERRQFSLDHGIARLAELFARVGDQDPQRVCDTVLNATTTDGEDDIAVLVLRCGPTRTEDTDPSPGHSGPGVAPG